MSKRFYLTLSLTYDDPEKGPECTAIYSRISEPLNPLEATNLYYYTKAALTRDPFPTEAGKGALFTYSGVLEIMKTLSRALDNLEVQK